MSVFQMILESRMSNNPAACKAIADLLDNFSKIIKQDFQPGMESVVEAATKATATLFCVVITAKHENVELGLDQMIRSTTGRSYGAKLLRWVTDRMDLDKSVWHGFQQQMSNTIMVMIHELESIGFITVEQATTWIKNRGGLYKVGMSFLDIQRQEKAQKERDAIIGRRMEEFREAQEAGFESYELYQAHRSAQAQEEIERGLRAKFGQVKRKIIENGEVIRNPKNNQLIIASDGKLYAISSADEYWMLHCAAKVL